MFAGTYHSLVLTKGGQALAFGDSAAGQVCVCVCVCTRVCVLPVCVCV
ncbi:MAG: RCC1 domain-containing protein [Terracidiphilus sp.]|nr:RCC1 domain-containing protein [Terracidiphilus sp.]